MDKQQSSEDLIADQFNIESWKSFSSLVFDQIIEISVVMSHGDVEELPTLLKGGESA